MPIGPGDAVAIAALCLQIYDTFHDVREKAPAEFQVLADEFDQFNDIFQKIHRQELRSLREKYRLRPYTGWNQLAQTLAKCKSFIDKCKPILETEWSKNKMWRTVRWPFNKEEVQSLRQEISSHAHRLTIHLQVVSTELNLEVLDHVERISSPSGLLSPNYHQASPTGIYCLCDVQPSAIAQDRRMSTATLDPSVLNQRNLRSYTLDSGIGLSPTDTTISRMSPQDRSTCANCGSLANNNHHLPASASYMPDVTLGLPALSLEDVSTPVLNFSSRSDNSSHQQNSIPPSDSVASSSNMNQRQSSDTVSRFHSSSPPRSPPVTPSRVWTELVPFAVFLGFTKRTRENAMIDVKLLCARCNLTHTQQDPCPNILLSSESSSGALAVRTTCKRSGEILLEAQFSSAKLPTPHTKHTQLCRTEKLRVFFKDANSPARIIINGIQAKAFPYVELANADNHKAFQETVHGLDLVGSFNVNSFETSRGLDMSQTLRVWRDRASGEMNILFWAALEKNHPGRFWDVPSSDFILQQKVRGKSNAVKLLLQKTPNQRRRFSRRSSLSSQSNGVAGSSNYSTSALTEFDDLIIDFDIAEERQRFLSLWPTN